MSIQNQKKKKISALSNPKPNGESKNQRKKNKKKRRKESERPRGESYEQDGERQRGNGVAVMPWRRETESETRARECEVRTQLRARPTPARAKPTPPCETRSTCCRCRRLPFPDLPSPASSLHRITVHRSTGIYSLTLIFSFKFQNLVNLWSKILRIKETVLVVFECFLFVFLLMNWSYWTDLVIWCLCCGWTELFVIFFFFFLGFWLCDSVFVALAALHYIDKRDR